MNHDHDVYTRLVDLADEAAWYRAEAADALERARTLRREANRSTSKKHWFLRRLASAQERHATVSGRLAHQCEEERQTLIEALPDPPLDDLILPQEPGPDDRLAELRLRLHDAQAREDVASREADDHITRSLAAWPWQRALREEHWLRTRYAEACLHAHASSVERLRAEITTVSRADLI